MATLTPAARQHMPPSAFAGPGHSFPINDPNGEMMELWQEPSARYITLPMSMTDRAIVFLRRADGYRRTGWEKAARDCERKALKKFAASFRLRNWPHEGPRP